MKYPVFRCTECSLMRCTIPNVACDECHEYLFETGNLVVDFEQPIAAKPPQPFHLICPPGVHLDRGASGYICYGTGVLTDIQLLQDGEIHITDAGGGLIPSNGGKIVEWNSTKMRCPVMPAPFQYGMYVVVLAGSFALQFREAAGILYTVPY